MKNAKDTLSVRIATWEVINFLVEIQWGQEEIIAILDDALRSDRLKLADLPDGGNGLAKALKVTNWAFEKVINQVCTGEPFLDELYCDDEKAEAAITKISDEAARKLESVLDLKQRKTRELLRKYAAQAQEGAQ